MTERCPQMMKPCADCPWRRDAPPGHFPPERYAALASSVEQGFGAMFGCHSAKADKDAACAGYLLSDDCLNNFRVRMLLASGQLDRDRVSSDVPLFETYREMVEAQDD